RNRAVAIAVRMFADKQLDGCLFGFPDGVYVKLHIRRLEMIYAAIPEVVGDPASLQIKINRAERLARLYVRARASGFVERVERRSRNLGRNRVDDIPAAGGNSIIYFSAFVSDGIDFIKRSHIKKTLVEIIGLEPSRRFF